jgi:catechol 2,3-dioxygenase-like lactoylglutathione lyase family enzyme
LGNHVEEDSGCGLLEALERYTQRAAGCAKVCQNSGFESHEVNGTYMVGQFLEFSVGAEPLAASHEFYRAIGFTSVPVSDVLPDPYLVFFDGDVAIGLHERELPGPLLTFVRPQLKDYSRALRRIGIELEYANLADHEFNRVGFSDPSGQPVALLEARTFPPGEWNRHNVSACGDFLEYSIATDSLGQSRVFWEALGFAPVAAGESPHPWLRLEGHGVVIGLHESRFRPGLSFCTDLLEPRLEYLRAKGIQVRAGGPLAEHKRHSATVTAPEGTPIYLFEVVP